MKWWIALFVIVLIMLALTLGALRSEASGDSYPGYTWVDGAVIGAYHRGAVGHYLVVQDARTGRVGTCAVSLATWLWDTHYGHASCWGK